MAKDEKGNYVGNHRRPDNVRRKKGELPIPIVYKGDEVKKLEPKKEDE